MNIELYCQDITDDLMGLLLLADPDMTSIKGYIDRSTIFVARQSGVVVGVVVLTSDGIQQEIKNLAVLKSHQNQGIAKHLIFKAKEYAKGAGATKIIVGTGNSSLDQLALYQKCGFRMQEIRSNYFRKYPDPIIENGIRCLDMVVLSSQIEP